MYVVCSLLKSVWLCLLQPCTFQQLTSFTVKMVDGNGLAVLACMSLKRQLYLLMAWVFRHVCKIVTSDYWLCHVCLSVCMEQCNCNWTDFPAIWYLSIFWKSVKKIKFYSNLTRITGTLNEYICTFMIISCSVLLRMRNVSDKSCRENNNRHFMFSNVFPNILLLIRLCEKIWYSQTGHRWHYNMAYAFFMPDN